MGRECVFLVCRFVLLDFQGWRFTYVNQPLRNQGQVHISCLECSWENTGSHMLTGAFLAIARFTHVKRALFTQHFGICEFLGFARVNQEVCS